MNLVVQRYRRKQLHVVLDNSSSHSTPEVKAWLEAHPRVHFHYTPTSASWLNQVEGFFGIRKVRQLEEENSKLKRLVAHLSLDKVMLQDLVSRKW
jgi:transposase